MLEVLNLTKIYKTKGGEDVKALDSVSLQFPETGMVFLLGKSGSGKSTLLNVCGGLDSPTSGEIIVKGRSSKKFSQSDFDSYRNTYVGFIFQEYNILNEFTVEDNIALALELQGKSKDKKSIAELLESVDLVGFARRWPNTLSGGQKQRIAIARALVKAPEIIMADEPTGALDSTTGTQVFETLKKLSKDKLVIVVSHDRDFAELYGDRIIELKDGKIISDITKTTQQQKSLTQNVNVVGDILCVQGGSKLTEQDFEEIKTFLKKSRGDIIIAGGEKDVKTFKSVSRISDDGDKEVFKETDENELPKKIYKPEDSRFIRSKLPIRHASKIGISSMGNKPIRLSFTILLCTIAFIFFGLLSTMSFYDSKATYMETITKSNIALVRLDKKFTVEEQWYNYGELEISYPISMEAKFSEQELLEYKEKFGSDIFGGVNSYSTLNVISSSGEYWSNNLSVFGYLPKEHVLRGTIKGTYPSKENEICISSYTAEVLYQCKTSGIEGHTLELKSPEDILTKSIMINGDWYQVTGIFESGELSDKYDVLKNEASEENYLLMNEFYNTLSDGLYLTAFVSKDKMESLAEKTQFYYGEEVQYMRTVVVNGKVSNNLNALYESYSELLGDNSVVWIGSDRKTLKEQEIVIDDTLFYQLVSDIYGREYEDVFNSGSYETEGLKKLIDRMERDGISLTVGVQLYNESTASTIGEVREFHVVGIRTESKNQYGTGQIFLSEAVFGNMWDEQKVTIDYYCDYVTDYVEPVNAMYSNLYVGYKGDEYQKQLIWEMNQESEYGEEGTLVTVSSSLIDTLRLVDEIVDILSSVFLYAGIVLAIFAALLFSNFISVSISYKKKEIGILRAVGARGVDVFKIFFSESFVIAVICLALSFVGSHILCNVLNKFVASEFGASVFVFGPKSWFVMIVIAVVTAVIATFLPVWNAAKKKPVESIRAL